MVDCALEAGGGAGGGAGGAAPFPPLPPGLLPPFPPWERFIAILGAIMAVGAIMAIGRLDCMAPPKQTPSSNAANCAYTQVLQRHAVAQLHLTSCSFSCFSRSFSALIIAYMAATCDLTASSLCGSRSDTFNTNLNDWSGEQAYSPRALLPQRLVDRSGFGI